jgi:hypothetical protein
VNLGAAATGILLGAARTATAAGRKTDRRIAVRNILAVACVRGGLVGRNEWEKVGVAGFDG